MLTQETNERLTRTGPDTPAGRLLRHYWHPIGTRVELEKEPVQPVRLLSENLTLFLDTRGNVGLIGDRCAHRAISLAYGIPQDSGLRCAYHGWTYDAEGRVVDMPFEPACLPLKVNSYPVEEMGGLVWTYMGPEPRPLLPRFDGYVKEDMDRKIQFKSLPCNWLQCMDNSLDPVHFTFLHATYGNYYNARHGKSAAMNIVNHLKIDFDVFEYGIYKRRLLDGEPEESDDWQIGHPILFPYTLALSGGGTGNASYQLRIPTDDTNTMHILYTVQKRAEGDGPKPLEVIRESVVYNNLGLVDAAIVVHQDEMAWIGQGAISDRTREHLATSDKGLMLYHNLILENIAKVERGEEPIGVVRDPSINLPMIEIGHETQSLAAFRRGIAAQPTQP